MFVDKPKRGFPLSPPDSFDTGLFCISSGLEIVVLDIIYKTCKVDIFKIHDIFLSESLNPMYG